MHHDHVGDLHLRYQGFAVADDPGQQIFVYTAVPGSPSADALTLLHRYTTTHSTTDSPAATDHTDFELQKKERS